MGLWSRLRRALGLGQPAPRKSGRPSRGGRRGGQGGGGYTPPPIITGDDDSGFPANWQIVGLHTEGEKTRPVNHFDVRDRDIARADFIVVRHINPRNGVVSHRNVYGADSKDKVGKQIIHTVAPGSPPGTRSRDK